MDADARRVDRSTVNLRARPAGPSTADLAQVGTHPEESAATPFQYEAWDVDLSPGTSFGPYVIQGVLAVGGMGVVYQARGPAGPVALKTLRLPEGSPQWAEAVARFEREADAGRLAHDNLVRVLDCGVADGRAYLTMELAAGCLARRRAEFYGRPQAVAALMAQVAAALAWVHGQGTVHRDIKPGNILLTADGKPLLADFGLARPDDLIELRTLTVPLSVLGTPAYMAPEQADGQAVDSAADVWSAGVIVYELLAKGNPFDAGDREASLERVLSLTPPRLRKVVPGIDPRLDEVVAACLSRRPAKRPTAQELADVLGRCAAGPPAVARQLPSRRLPPPAGRTALAGLVASLLLLTALGGLTAASAPPRPTELDWASKQSTAAKRAWLQRKIADRQTVKLLGPAGWPRWWEFYPDRLGTHSADAAGGALTVTAAADALLGLAPAAPAPPYRFDVELVHADAAGNGQVGVFVGRQVVRRRGKDVTTFVGIQFSDRRDEAARPRAGAPAGNPVRPVGVLWPHAPAVRYEACAFLPRGATFRFTPAARVPGSSVVRTLSVLVTADRLTYSLDGREAGELPFDSMNYSLCRCAAGVGLTRDETPKFDPAGALGVFLGGSTAEIRSATLTPLEAALCP